MPQSMPPCPRCNTNKKVRANGGRYWCDRCNGLFDDDPDEGGSYFSDPSKRLERQEERRNVRRHR